MSATPVVTEDISQLVDDCVNSLTLSEPFLCHKDSFSLHDSMAALQLTDPIMDCCEVAANHYATTATTTPCTSATKTIFPRPPPTGLKDAFVALSWDELTLKDSAYFGLETLIRFEAFLAGASVGESAGTCLYAHAPVIVDMERALFGDGDGTTRDNMLVVASAASDTETTAVPNSFPKSIVYAFTVALLQVTEDTRSIIVDADIYEEEDFSHSSQDASFLANNAHDGDELLPFLTILLQQAEKRVHGTIEEEEQQYSKVIVCVLTFYSAFLSLAQTLSHCPTDQATVQKALSQASQALGQLEAIVNVIQDDENENNSIRQRAFDSFVNRPLVGNAPVRHPNFKPSSDTITELQRIVGELQWGLCGLLTKANSLAKVHCILDRVQQQASGVSIYTRSLIVLNLFFSERLVGQYDLKVLIIEHMRQWTHIPDAVLDDENAKQFLGRLAKPIYEVLKLKLLNRCRQRAFIEAILIPDWLVLQSEAHMVDLHYRRAASQVVEANEPPYFSQFVLVVVLRLMDRYLSSGAELGLFCGYQEIASVFWYREYLLSALLNNLMAMRRAKTQMLLRHHEEAALPVVSVKGNAKGNGKRKHKIKSKPLVPDAPKPTLEDAETESEIILLTLQRDLCRGLKRLLALLQQVGILRPDVYEFTSPRRVFEERFDVFRTIQQPPVLEFEDFLAGSDFSQVSAPDLFRTTAECFQTCKRTADQLLHNLSKMDPACLPFQESDVRWLQKVCVGNAIYLVKLQSILQAGNQSSSKVVFDFDGPNQFCIVKLQT